MIPSGEWHTYRGNDRLTAHCDLPGNISQPQVSWKLPVGGTRQHIVPLKHNGVGNPEILLCYGGVIIRADVFGKHRWESKPMGIQSITAVLDIDGDGREEIVVCNGIEVMLLSADDGGVVWRYNVAAPVSYGVYASSMRVHNFFPPRTDSQLLVPLFHTNTVLMFEFSRGAEKGTLMHSLQMNDAFHPTVLIGDVDADGNDEICVCRLGDLAVFDAHNGIMQSFAEWKTDGERRRTYGLIELKDIDADGVLECVFISNQVTRHIAVLDNDGESNFSLMWDRFIEHIYPNDTKEVRYANNSLCDCDGDGKQEIIASIFNGSDDARWRTEIINSETGETKLSLEDRYFWDARDIDNDGLPELFLSKEHSRMVQELSDLEIIRSHHPESPVWTRSQSSFVAAEGTLKRSQGIYRTELFGKNELMAEGENFFVYDNANRVINISFNDFRETIVSDTRQFNERQFVASILPPYFLFSGAMGKICTVEASPNGGVIRAEFQCGASLSTDGHPVERPSPTPVVFATNGKRWLAVPDYGRQVRLYRNSDAGEPALVWSKPGKGRIGFDLTHHSVSVADISGTGELQILMTEPDLHAVLAAYSVAGDCVKRFLFMEYPSIGGGMRTGSYDWLALNNGQLEKLFVSFYASLSMNSESSVCINAATGDEIWRRASIGEGEAGRGFGAWGLASSPDGSEIFFCAKDVLCRVDANTGKIIGEAISLTAITRAEMIRRGIYKGEDITTWVTREDPFTAYGSVVFRDVNGDGCDEIFVMGNFGGFGALDSEMNVLWWSIAPMSDTLYRLGGIAALRGREKYSLGVGHANGDFVCYDALTGGEEWRIALGDTTIDCATCDIDGDGRDEFVCRTTDGRLLAIGVNDSDVPVIKWSLAFEYSVGNPVIADFNGDGFPEIYVVNGDGWMYCIE